MSLVCHRGHRQSECTQSLITKRQEKSLSHNSEKLAMSISERRSTSVASMDIGVSSSPLHHKSDSDGESPAVQMASFHIDDREDFKDESLYTFCGSCKNHVMTMVTYRVGKMTIVFAAALCLLGCLGGCCLVPFLWKRFQDVEHVCPNCQLRLGKYRRPTKNICCKK